MQNIDDKQSLTSTYVLYFYSLHWSYILKNIFKEIMRDILSKDDEICCYQYQMRVLVLVDFHYEVYSVTI